MLAAPATVTTSGCAPSGVSAAAMKLICSTPGLDGLVERMTDEAINPAQALVAVADYVLHDAVLRPDYAVLTAARGLSLERGARR